MPKIDIAFAVEPSQGVVYPYRVRFSGKAEDVDALIEGARDAGMLNAERNSASVAVSAHDIANGQVCTVVEVASVDTYEALLAAMEESHRELTFNKPRSELVEEALALTARPKQLAENQV